MKRYHLYALGILLLLSGCVKRYKRTTKLCNDRLYVEVYNVNPAGVDADYLTDSVNFRMYVGKFDNEHEIYSFICQDDSVVIIKLTKSDTSGIMEVMETKVYSLQNLKKEKVFE